MKKMRITIGEKIYDVTVEILEEYAPQRLLAKTAPPASTPLQAPSVSASPRPSQHANPGAVTSPLAGKVKAVLAEEGNQVKQGQPLIILEAMKMENKVLAPRDGTVKSISVHVGDSVQEAQSLLVLADH